MEKQKKSVIGNKRNGEKPSASATKGRSHSKNASFDNRQPQRTRPQKSKTQSTHPTKAQPHRNSSSINRKQRKRKKKKSFFKKTLIFLLILLLGSTAYAASVIKFSNLNKDLSNKASKYNISSSASNMALNHRIVNIAIFGVDGRSDVEGDRSDSMMIASADFEHNKIKVTSLMRDTYVYINKDTDYDKLNSAYAIGGPDLALKVINQNFDTAITDYVTIDFTSMVEMVNAVGGVTINIGSDDELYWINQYLMDVNDKVKTSSPDVPGTGDQILDGSQALSYCRVRYVGNGDFDRTERQRKVFEQVLQKAMDLNPLAQYNLLNKVMPYTKTSLSFNEILKYAGNAMLMKGHEIQQMRVPTDQYVETGMLYDVSYVFPVTLVDNIKALYQFIYEADYTPSSGAQGISRDIEDVW
ncbi:MAG: LCP family protein [Eubacterium sp.]